MMTNHLSQTQENFTLKITQRPTKVNKKQQILYFKNLDNLLFTLRRLG